MTVAAIWGQFLLHDVSHTPQAAGFLGQRLKCCNVDFEDFHPECYPIKVPANDPFYGRFGVRCQEYARSVGHYITPWCQYSAQSPYSVK